MKQLIEFIKSNLNNKFKNLLKFIIDLLFPINCLNCGKENIWLCKKCFSKLNVNSDFFCPKCHKKTNFGKYCKNCKQNHELNGVFPALNYNNKLTKKLIKTYKYYFAKDISNILSNYLTIYLQNILNKTYFLLNFNNNKKIKIPDTIKNFKKTLIIPVPLHKKRKKWRGFNQSNILAINIANKFNLQINNIDLKRIKYTKPQAKFTAKKRIKNIINCFKWIGNDLNGKNIILIDDVASTCSTLNECAKILKQNNANEVWGLVVAKG